MSTKPQRSLPEEDRLEVRNFCGRYDGAPAALIEILHDVQGALGFLPEGALLEIADCLNITRAEVHGVASFYDDFRCSLPAGTLVRICRGEACQSMGAHELEAALRSRTGAETDIEIEPVFCLGNCALAPAASIGGKLHGRLSIKRLAALVEGEAK